MAYLGVAAVYLAIDSSFFFLLLQPSNVDGGVPSHQDTVF